MSATVQSFVVRITRDDALSPERPGPDAYDIKRAMTSAFITCIGWGVTKDALDQGLIEVEVSPIREVEDHAR